MKKILWAFGLFLILAAGIVIASTGNFSDSGSFSNWYKSSVENMRLAGVIGGYPDGSFKPDNNVNRAEMATMLDKLQKYEDSQVESKLEGTLFYLDQYSTYGEWKVPFAMASAELKVMNIPPNLGDNYFNKNPITTDSKGGAFPQGWTGYNHRVPDAGGSKYLHYVGKSHPTGFVLPQDLDIWYGPFSDNFSSVTP